MTNLINGDARHIALADESVQCIITSPPYWALRSYLAADDSNKSLELGAERVPDCLGWATGQPCGSCYVCHIVSVMRECWRVLRSDGVAFLNLGDSYASQGGYRDYGSFDGATGRSYNSGTRASGIGLKPKDLCLIPSRVALALQAAGWWVRSMIPWLKRNAMPESTTDRPTSAVEYVYLLSKREKYYFDAEAIKASSSENSGWAKQRANGKNTWEYNDTPDRIIQTGQRIEASTLGTVGSRNRRNSDWFFESWQGLYLVDDEPAALIVNPQPYSGAHFATFPPALVEPMILAGTSARGACPTCGKAWRRVVDRSESSWQDRKAAGHVSDIGGSIKLQKENGATYDFDNSAGGFGAPATSITIGFAPACACYAAPPLPAEPADTSNGEMAAYRAERARLLNDVYPLLPVVPCVVFDPFVGSGTVLRVAIKHGRIGIGNDLNLNYAPLTVDRTSKIQTMMPL